MARGTGIRWKAHPNNRKRVDGGSRWHAPKLKAGQRKNRVVLTVPMYDPSVSHNGVLLEPS